jgi:hypothetical protein
MVVDGVLHSEQGVLHVVAERVADCTQWLGHLNTTSRDFH